MLPRVPPPGAIMTGIARDTLAAIERERPVLAYLGPLTGAQPLCAGASEAFPLATFTLMLETAATELGDAGFGLMLGQKFSLAALGALGELMAASPSVGAAIEDFVHYFSLVQTNSVNALTVSNGVARLSYVITDATVRCRTQDANFTLAMEDGFMRALLGEAWRPLAVDLAHAPGDGLADYQRQFGCKLRFGAAQNALYFPAAVLERVPRGADAARYAALRAGLDGDLSGQTRRLDLLRGFEAWITAGLCHALPTDVEDAAAAFGMSLRSFQRGLKAQGLNFAQLRSEVRLDLSRSLLEQTDLPVTAIGQRLGFSETSAFSRAFRTLTGQAPAAYRQRTRAAWP